MVVRYLVFESISVQLEVDVVGAQEGIHLPVLLEESEACSSTQSGPYQR